MVALMPVFGGEERCHGRRRYRMGVLELVSHRPARGLSPTADFNWSAWFPRRRESRAKAAIPVTPVRDGPPMPRRTSPGHYRRPRHPPRLGILRALLVLLLEVGWRLAIIPLGILMLVVVANATIPTADISFWDVWPW